MMAFDLLVELACKSIVGALLTLAILRVLNLRSAAEKSIIASFGLFALMALPIAILGLPKVNLALPAAIRKLVPLHSAEGLPPLPVASDLEATPPVDWESAAVLLYLLISVVLLLALSLAVARLRLIRARAGELRDPRWLAALAASRHGLRVKRDVVLLVSNEINSPVSWGLRRPVIILDPRSASDAESAEAIVTHELAHVARLDWLRLLLGRAAAAVFWFNPFVFALARRSLQLCEEAADDAVLRARVDEADYAGLLVKTVRHADGRPLLAANAVAAGRCSVSARVTHILDTSRSRAPADFGSLAVSLLAAASLGGTLAAARPVSASDLEQWRAPATAVDKTFESGASPASSAPPKTLAAATIATAGTADSGGTLVAMRPRPEAARTPSRDSDHAAAASAQAPAGKPGAAVADVHDPTREALGIERAQRGARWSKRGAQWEDRGAVWSERGARWSDRGDLLAKFAADRTGGGRTRSGDRGGRE